MDDDLMPFFVLAVVLAVGLIGPIIVLPAVLENLQTNVTITGTIENVIITDGFGGHDSTQITFTDGTNLSFDGIHQGLQNGHTYKITYTPNGASYRIIAIETIEVTS